MRNPLFLLVFIASITTFLALFLSVILHKFTIPKHKDTFRQTLKFGLLGELIGLIIFIIAWIFKKYATNSWATPGLIGMIPLSCMMAGVFLGMYLLYGKKINNQK